MHLQLEIWPAANIKFTRDVSSPEIDVGRSIECVLTIAHNVVSNQHAKFHDENGRFLISDLNSTNGTYVNGSKIAVPTEVRSGDEIVLGVNGPMLKLISLSDEHADEKDKADLSETNPLSSAQHDSLVETAEVVEVESVEQDQAQLAPLESPASDPQGLPEIPVPFVPLESVEYSNADDLETAAKHNPYEKIPRPSGSLFHVVSLFLTIAAMFLFSAIYIVYTFRHPARGYTFFGLLFGMLGTLLFFGVVIYFLRKRWGQEQLPGKLRTWLRIHFWFSLAGFWLVLLHAGFNFDGGTGTWTILFLFLTILTGIVGWFFYNRLPLAVYGNVGNLASSDLKAKIQRYHEEIEDAVAGQSNNLAVLAQIVLSGGILPTLNLVPSEHPIAGELIRLGNQCKVLRQRIRIQGRYRFWLRTWLWLHIPIAFFFVGFFIWHAFEATEATSLVFAAGPNDYASSESCAQCHRSQYDEWIGSMHAIAQSSPVTDLQNRLVLLKEQVDLESGALTEPIVGTLCVRCHAPTGYLGSKRGHEDPLCAIIERAPASQFGVSCVACHQIEQIHKGDAANDPNKLEYKNIENLEYTQGKLMLGPFGSGDRDDLPSIGNQEHRGEFRSHFNDSSFCASCHTVVVDHPVLKDAQGNPERIVKLQDTYTEWLDGGENINWSRRNVQCLDCHGRDLGDLAKRAESMQEARTPLLQRMNEFQAAFANAQKVFPRDQLAATENGSFDLKLPARRKFLHTFSGVDYHLEPTLPYPAGHPRESDNPTIQQQTVKHTQDLLKVAAAIRVDSISGNTARVDVLNMGTGHHLPAGFSFAREMWVEVSVSANSVGESENDWVVIIGGNTQNLKPIENSRSLDKKQIGLKNFQSVLYSGAPRFDAAGKLTSHEKGVEVVLQNEARAVLTGETATAQGFQDREKFMLPGEIRSLQISLPANWETIAGGKTRRLRTRLLFRNYPPEFITGLADKFTELSDQANAERSRKLVNHLRIHEMTRDTFPVPP
jgi:mono/diheme cytochrome c family protein